MSDFLQRWTLSSELPSTRDMRLFQRRWAEDYQTVAGRPPRLTLSTALTYFDQESGQAGRSNRSTVGFAVDLGCGDGRDTVELLRHRWRVLAIDGEPTVIGRLRQRQDIDRTYLETRTQPFEDLTLPPDIDLVNASFSLPFCPPKHFPDLWEEIEMALRPGGRFCGQLFGDRDSWAVYPDMTYHSRNQVEQLLAAFDIELLDEEDHSGETALGDEKHWHLYNIVARKR